MVGRTSTRCRPGTVFVYGYDYGHPTGEFMATADLEIWDTGYHVGLGDFAFSPADPDVVVG
jgi:hypothetical protein